MKTKEQKRNEAKERQAKYDSLTLEQKLDLLRTRPGASLREGMRLMHKEKKHGN